MQLNVFGEIMPISNAFQIRITELVEDCEVNKSELPNLIGVDYRTLSNALNYGIMKQAEYFNCSSYRKNLKRTCTSHQITVKAIFTE